MKFNKRLIMQLSSVLVAVVLLTTCFVSPVNAAGIDNPLNFSDIYDNKYTSGGRFLYELNVPDDYGTLEMFRKTDGVLDLTEYFYLYMWRSVDFDALTQSQVFEFDYRAFFNGNFIKLDNILAGSSLKINFDFSIYSESTWFYPYVQYYISYYDSNLNYLSQQVVDLGRNYDKAIGGEHAFTSVTFDFDDAPAGAKYFYVGIDLEDFYIIEPPGTYPVNLAVDQFKLTLDSPSPLSGDSSGDNSDIIIDQNQDLINGTPEQNDKVDSAVGGMDSAGDKLGSLNDQMQVEKPDIDSFDVSIESMVPYESLLAYTMPFTKLWESNTLLGMLMIVLTLVLVSWVMFGKKG